jgi:hypothetical protein
LRRHLGFANVVSLIALFVALGGTSVAAFKIKGSQIQNRSVSGSKLKRNTLGGAVIKESRLGRVPRAKRADRVGGLSAAELKLRCPAGTVPVSGVCLEERARAPVAYGGARVECGIAGRRVPTYEEVVNFHGGRGGSLPPGGELTSDVSRSTSGSGSVDVLVVTDEAGDALRVPNTAAGARAFRCAAYPSN